MKSFTDSGKMICPTCLSWSIMLTALWGHLHHVHGQPNVLRKYRCEEGHSFATVSVFDGKRYHEYYAPYADILSQIVICWD